MKVAYAKPLTTAKVGRGRIRLFQSPLEGPDWPWSALSDAVDCVCAASSWKREICERWERKFPQWTRYARLRNEELPIMPSLATTGVFEALILGDHDAELENEQYNRAVSRVFSDLTPDDEIDEALAFACQRWYAVLPQR